MIKVEKLNPFGRMCVSLGMLPSSYKESLTYEEQLLWFCNYLTETVIPTVNNNAEALEEVQALYIEIKSYVDDYFDNLDVQEEINNKLDDMAESGELTEIIAQYLQLAGVLAYDTVSDMSEAENIVEGSICKTLGKVTYNDGLGAFYKVRTITNSDVVDDYNIVALDVSQTLIAERIKDYQIKKVILVGDSYGNETGEWADVLTNIFVSTGKYQSSDFYNCCESGASSSKRTGTSFPTFLEIMQNHSTTIADKNSVEKIVLCGGYNDYEFTYAQIFAGLQAFHEYCVTNYPNATIYYGMIGWSNATTNDSETVRDNLVKNALRAYQNMSYYGGVYLTNVESVTHLYGSSYWKTDNFHPSNLLSDIIARNIYNALINGSANFSLEQTEDLASSTLIKKIRNNNTSFHWNRAQFSFTDSPVTLAPGQNTVNLLTTSSNLIRTVGSWSYLPCSVLLAMTAANTRLSLPGYIQYKNGIFKLIVTVPATLEVRAFQVDLNVTMDSMNV